MLNVRPQDVVISRPVTDPIDVEQAEAALVEHYPRLVRLAYLVLPPRLGRNRRVLTAHSLAQRSLPRGRTPGVAAGLPLPRRAGGASADPGYAYVRQRVLRQALEAGLPLRRRAWPKRAQLPPLLPQVWGLRLFPRSGGADELALDQRLSALSGPGRAAYVLRGLERMQDPEVVQTLAAAGAADPQAALAEADGVEAPGGVSAAALLGSGEFDPCSLQARPTDLMRRRQHAKAALAATAAVVVCGALLGLPGEGWGPDGAAAPAYVRNPAAERALDPSKTVRVAAEVWKRSSRTDFSVWPARGNLTDDNALLRRALAVWARPGPSVQTSATPATPVGPPMGSPHMLFAGDVDRARVVLLYDGLRVVRYAEPRDGAAGAALDFARVDGADAAAANALVVGRTDGNVRYLTAPWVREASVRDLLDPTGTPVALKRTADGVTDPLTSPAQARDCRSWDALELRDDAGPRLMTDLGELAPARLTSGPPSAPRDVSGPEERARWARTACLLPAVRSHGVRTVNSWTYAQQPLPEGNGTAVWLCTRAETWRGTGSRVLAQFQAPSAKRGAPGAIAARAEHSPACGVRDPRVLAGVLWKSRGGNWYVLAAGSGQFTSVTTSGGVEGTARGNLLAVPAKAGVQADLEGRVVSGERVGALR
ncbi:hypothetical protein AS594_24545 [Streptomyces agglomeratus]|uniref:DNA-directed RNA polymerase specialized sigma24 family protein n=1 Tax=Streptomyces agglomeratus TaxID=285458 RepID=A0A1E5PCA8_9ACTN|nr:hypothetical protein [Streptomyces agglomeratus]OEJ27173.1 hypothetical protein AS594_24545 [Streptomyces agglomeratus]